MKVIFVASGNKKVGTVSAFVRSQFESLKDEGVEMILFPIEGKGWKSYAKACQTLRHLIKVERPNIVHAHYSVCGYVAFLASLFTKSKVVVSILGSFPKDTFKLKLVRFCIKHLWDCTLVKSQRTANQLGIDLPVIPNGVCIDKFQLIDQGEARSRCGFESSKKHIIWCSNPSRPEKDFPLAEKSIQLLSNQNALLHPIFDKNHSEIVNYMCAADVLLLTSVSEGSPNVIKEAMVCNCPIVATDVGDVAWVTQDVPGTYVCADRTPEKVAQCLQLALQFNQRTLGRERILKIGLTTELVAKRIIQLYQKCMNNGH